MNVKLIRCGQVQTKAAPAWAARLLSLVSLYKPPRSPNTSSLTDIKSRQIKETVHVAQRDLFKPFKTSAAITNYSNPKVTKLAKSAILHYDLSKQRLMWIRNESVPQVRSSGLIEVMSWPCRDWGNEHFVFLTATFLSLIHRSSHRRLQSHSRYSVWNSLFMCRNKQKEWRWRPTSSGPVDKGLKCPSKTILATFSKCRLTDGQSILQGTSGGTQFW